MHLYQEQRLDDLITIRNQLDINAEGDDRTHYETAEILAEDEGNDAIIIIALGPLGATTKTLPGSEIFPMESPDSVVNKIREVVDSTLQPFCLKNIEIMFFILRV